MNEIDDIYILREEVAELNASLAEACMTKATLRADLAQRTAERDALQLRWQRLYGEIDCRIEHGASSNGHLEAIRKMMREAKS